MKRHSKQSGFSLVELMVASMVLVIVFGGAFAMLTKTRKVARAQNISGPHIHFETFAASKLKLYFSKLLQWTMHVASEGGKAGDVGRFCEKTAKFAYAGNFDGDGDFGAQNFPVKGTSQARRTLGADMRMALSTFDYNKAKGNKGLAKRHSEAKDFPWGALVPFDNRDGITGINDINPALAAFCGDDKSSVRAESGADNVREMCAWVDVCSAQEANRSANPPHPKVQNSPELLAFKEIGPNEVALKGRKSFRMCFAFVGNLFSRTGNFVSSSGASSTGIDALDNPAVLGLAVATATFVNTNSGEEMTCDDAKHQIYRSLKVSADIFTASNVDRSLNTKKQLYFKSRQQFVSEKLGVALPNCEDPSRNSPVNLAGAATCIGDPTFHFACSTSCADPDPAY